MKPILPTLKEKKRYVVFEIISNENFDDATTKKFIYDECLKFLGELGISRAELMFVEDQFKNNKGILKVNNKYVDEIKLSLSLIKSINGKKVIVNVIGVKFIEKMEDKK